MLFYDCCEHKPWRTAQQRCAAAYPGTITAKNATDSGIHPLARPVNRRTIGAP